MSFMSKILISLGAMLASVAGRKVCKPDKSQFLTQRIFKIILEIFT